MNSISNAERFDDVDARFDRVDERLADHDVHFAEIKEHFTELRAYIDFGLAELRDEMSSGFQRLERKVDQILDKLL
jgi:hypothetical protein